MSTGAGMRHIMGEEKRQVILATEDGYMAAATAYAVVRDAWLATDDAEANRYAADELHPLHRAMWFAVYAAYCVRVAYWFAVRDAAESV